MAEPEIRELLPPHTGRAYEAMRALRTHLESEEKFVERVDTVQRQQGYRVVGVFVEGEAQAAAVAGFRVLDNLAWGNTLYVDDLSTHPDHRRKGYGGRLMRWLIGEAERLGCDQFHLDSGVGPEREDAHRLYFNSGLRITSYHFARAAR
jgi:GNAT superfamily N-acetyltransferase